MADYTLKVPYDRGVGFMIGSIRPPLYGEGAHTFSIVGGDPSGLFRIGADTGVVEVNNEDYSDAYPFPDEIQVAIVHEGVTTQYTVAIQPFTWLERSRNTVYVDAFNGVNMAMGGMLTPIASMDLAQDMLRGGGLILLYPAEYGERVIQRVPCKVKGVDAEFRANLKRLSISNGLSLTVDQIYFTGEGVVAVNSTPTQKGSVTVRRSVFRGTRGIEVDNYLYANIHQNDVGTEQLGVDLRRVSEVDAHSNSIHGTIVA